MRLLSKLFFSNMHTWTDSTALNNAYKKLDLTLSESSIPDDKLGAIDKCNKEVMIESECQGFIQGFRFAVCLLAECIGGDSIE